MRARELLEDVRRELGPLNSSIVECAYLRDAREGRLDLDAIKLFVENQFYIVHHDARSLAAMASRASDDLELEYFMRLAQGDAEALRRLREMGRELGMELRSIGEVRAIPEAVGYTHFLSHLALHANPGEQAFALVVNLPVWSEACRRLLGALGERYGLKSLGFLELFAEVPAWVEEEGLLICERYVDLSGHRMRLFAALVQRYERAFWEGLSGPVEG
ncbi:MAG: TenA family transcriptional regulator [Aigarchaeota archaeon]|nr:TenA family transcriptional regulator [Aigarchaeota archaeon]